MIGLGRKGRWVTDEMIGLGREGKWVTDERQRFCMKGKKGTVAIKGKKKETLTRYLVFGTMIIVPLLLTNFINDNH